MLKLAAAYIFCSISAIAVTLFGAGDIALTKGDFIFPWAMIILFAITVILNEREQKKNKKKGEESK